MVDQKELMRQLRRQRQEEFQWAVAWFVGLVVIMAALIAFASMAIPRVSEHLPEPVVECIREAFGEPQPHGPERTDNAREHRPPDGSDSGN